MSGPVSKWIMGVVMMSAAVLVKTSYSATTNADHGLTTLDNILETDPSLLCYYITCQEPVSSDACPDGTIYIEGTSQYGCCGACVTFQKEKEDCTGTVDPSYGGGYTRNQKAFRASLYNVTDNVVHSLWCDYGYSCFKSKCYIDTSNPLDCRSMLEHYLEDVQDPDLYKYYRDDYRWKPSCTADRKFEPKQCLGPPDSQRCVCMDPDGNRIFGLAFAEEEELFNSMNCKCSRQAWYNKQAGETSVTLHCLTNGNYEPLQCEDGWCYCIDPDTAKPYGSRLSETAMHLLPCYNKTTTGEQYLRRCESEYHAHAVIVEAMSDSGVKGPESLTACDQDGSYNSRQCDQEMCRCWDKYMVDALSYPSGDDCQCARDRAYYTEMNSMMTISCIVNTGEYEPEQMQASYKYCVDEDGIRSGPLVVNSDMYTLDCDQAELCQKYGAKGTTHCSDVCVNKDSSSCNEEAYASYAKK